MAKKSHKKATRRKQIIYTAIGIVLFVILIGGMVWFFATTTKRTAKTGETFTREEQLANTRDEADEKARAGKVDEGARVYDQAIAATDDQAEKSQLMASKASIYLDDGKLDKALQYAQEAYALQATSVTAALVAQIYEAQPNTTKAAEFYRTAAEKVDANDPMASQDKEYYQAKASELGATQ